MRTWSIIGLGAGFAVLVLAVTLTAREPLMFLNLPGLALVLGGTLAATLTSYSLSEISTATRALVFNTGSHDDKDHLGLEDIIRVAKIMKTDGARAAEDAIEGVHSPFLRTGLQLVIDGAPSRQVLEVLDWRINRLQAHGQQQADVFNIMAVYAPAFGMVGTLLGLVNMLRDVGGGITEIGASLSIALVTTFYGIVLANAVFKPLAVCLRRRAQDRMAVLSVAQEALVILADQHSIAQLKYCLSSFVDPDDPDLIEGIADHDPGGNTGQKPGQFAHG